MARSTQSIYDYIVGKVQADTNLYDPTNPDPTKRGLTSVSKVSTWRLWAWIVAQAQNLFEQQADNYVTEVEAIVNRSAPGTPSWMQHMVYMFQYNATTPQVIQMDLNTFAPYYPTVTESYRIVTQCAVNTLPNKKVQIKVAKGGTTPAPLGTTEKQALTSYVDFINFAGVQCEIISADADLIYLGVDVYYNGQYSATIQADVEAAITSYLSTSNSDNFNYRVYISKLQDIIQAVAGVKDVALKQVEVRPASVSAGSAQKLVDASKILSRYYQPYAGYMIPDTDSGRTLADTINYIVA
jgi:hypothetical protein